MLYQRHLKPAPACLRCATPLRTLTWGARIKLHAALNELAASAPRSDGIPYNDAIHRVPQVSVPMRLIAFALLLFICSSVAQAQQFSSLEERMSYNEFKEAGLDKLSAEELARLNDWLRGNASGPAVTSALPPAMADRRGFSEPLNPDAAFTSRILGNFRGWRGSDSTFELENGMVWKSVDPAARLSVNLTDPEVTLTPGFMDAWFLKVEGYNASVRVKRIK